MSGTGEDRNGFGVATVMFSFVAVLLSMAALIVAAQAWSRSNEAKSDVKKVAAGGLLGSNLGVNLQEYKVLPTASEVKSGSVKFTVKNVGSIDHEMILVRGASAEALPKVTTPGGERAIGDVDEEAIPPADTIGEVSETKPGKTVVKSFKLTPGTYVVFCNIDQQNADGTVTSHFQQGMYNTLTVR